MFGNRAEDAFVNDPRGAPAADRHRGGWVFLGLVAAGLAAFVAWAAVFEIEETTRGIGRVIPSSQLQVVQAPEAGIVAAIEVAEGAVVEAGEVLIVIDDTGASSARGELLERQAALLAERHRTRAEAEGAEILTFPPELLDRAPNAAAAELEVFRSRRAQLAGELRVLEDRLAERRGELTELTAGIARTRAVIVPLAAEVDLTEDLVNRGAVPRVELLRLQGRLAELRGDLAVGAATEARLEAAIRAVEGEIETTKSAYVLAARERLADLQVELAVVEEALRAATDRVSRTALRAPVRGTVNTVHVSTIGAVVQPGAPLVEIVPIEDRLLIEADIRPQDVAFIRPGDRASVRITAYDYLVYGALEGEVLRIGADTIRNRDGQDFFRVAIRTDDTHLSAGGKAYPISPGMVAQIDIQTGTRTVLSYLAKPLLRARSEALRER